MNPQSTRVRPRSIHASRMTSTPSSFSAVWSSRDAGTMPAPPPRCYGSYAGKAGQSSPSRRSRRGVDDEHGLG